MITSGLDFLESAADHLAKGRDRPPLRRGGDVTAAIEAVLKAQLAREHWTLVVEDVNRAGRTEYETGDFRSVAIATAPQRLRNVGSSITKDEAGRITALEKLRNRVAHFALHGENPQLPQASTRPMMAASLASFLNYRDR